MKKLLFIIGTLAALLGVNPTYAADLLVRDQLVATAVESTLPLYVAEPAKVELAPAGWTGVETNSEYIIFDGIDELDNLEPAVVGDLQPICTDHIAFTVDSYDPDLGCLSSVFATPYWWAPPWSPGDDIVEESRIDLVQGLPGYSLIAGKDTLVAFTPYPSGMITGEVWSWLDVYKLHPWGAEFPELSYVRGTPVGEKLECNNQDGRCAEMNFFLNGEVLSEPGDYLFVITWHSVADGRQRTDWVYERFYRPAVTKVLFVPLGDDIFNTENLGELAMSSISHYFSRMPFPASAIEEKGPDQRYWDTYPMVPIADCLDANDRIDAQDGCITGAVFDALNSYNASAAVPANLAVGLFFNSYSGAAGYATGVVADCYAGSVGTCTHEIGHLLDPTEEPWDGTASTYTCGYFYDDLDYTFDCEDWAWDPATGEVLDHTGQWTRPANVMSWWGASGHGFFTRHFYEGACISLGGGCEAILSGTYNLKTLGASQYLDGHSQSDEVNLITAEGPDRPLWHAEFVSRSYDKTIVRLDVGGVCFGYCPFTMLIGNPTTGEVKTIDSGYFFHPNNADQFEGWCHEWEVDQIASTIVTLECHLWGNSGWFLTWDDTAASVGLDKPSQHNQEHWSPTMQWRVLKPKPYTSYPD